MEDGTSLFRVLLFHRVPTYSTDETDVYKVVDYSTSGAMLPIFMLSQNVLKNLINNQIISFNPDDAFWERCTTRLWPRQLLYIKLEASFGFAT